MQMQYILKNNLLKTLVFIGFFYFFAFAQLQSITSVFFKDTLNWTPGNIGFYFLILGIGDMFTQGFLTGKLLPRIGPIKLVFAGFLVVSLAFTINAFLPFFPFSVLAIPFVLTWALGSGLFEPSYGGLISGVASPQEQGRVQGASQSMQSITRILGPLFAAFLYQFNHSFPWITCIFFSLIGALLLSHYKNKIAKHIQETND